MEWIGGGRTGTLIQDMAEMPRSIGDKDGGRMCPIIIITIIIIENSPPLLLKIKFKTSGVAFGRASLVVFFNSSPHFFSGKIMCAAS